MDPMTARDQTLLFHDAVALWGMGLGDASDVVMAGCDALVAGLDGPALRMLAGISVRDAAYDLPEYLPDALRELGLEHLDRTTVAGQEAAVRAMARRLLAGKITPRNLVSRIHGVFGHELPFAEQLAYLDDQYDMVEDGDSYAETIDAEVVAEAQRLLDNHRS
jgi:hypothetical protein